MIFRSRPANRHPRLISAWPGSRHALAVTGGLPSRRKLIVGAGAATGAVLLDALALEPRWLEVSMHDVPIDGLPRSLDGFTIAQISDAHLQLVALTGDIVDGVERLPVLKEHRTGAAFMPAGAADLHAAPGLRSWHAWAES